MPVINKADQVAIANHLIEHLAGRVGIEVWTRPESALVLADRDPCTHCETVASVARELVSLHASLSLTRYDLERHAERAAVEGIERAPTTVLRAYGAQVQLVGYFSGLLFPALVDCILMAGAGAGPLQGASREALAELEVPVTLELLVAPYEPLSAFMLRLCCALAISNHSIRLVATEMSEFPILAQQRQMTEVPVVVINGRRFTGVFTESELIEQVRRVVAGNTEPVIREKVLSNPFMTVEEIDRLSAASGEATGAPSPGAQPGQTPGGLFIPGR